MAEATKVQCGETVNWTADAAYSAGDVVQLPDGRAGVVAVDCDSGDIVGVHVEGIFLMTKTTSMACLRGGRAYWDHSANKVSYKKVNDRDFYVGRYSQDQLTESATTCYVQLNIDPPYDIDMLTRDGALSVTTGTQALGGFLPPQKVGGSSALVITGTSEVQCVDMLSVDKFAVAANPIAEFVFRYAANGSTSAVDFNVGLANGTSTSDADAVTEHCYIHIDGGATTVSAQSKDGSTTVSAADTTKTLSAGSAVANRHEVWIDARDPADIQIYFDGVLVLGATAFNLGAAVGPLGLLVHLEKSTGTATAGPVYVDRAVARLTQS